MVRRVLLTGVSGFVGGALGVHLRSVGGYHVTGVSRGAARPGSVDAFFAQDLTKPLPDTGNRYDVVVHCAALSAPWGPPAAFRTQNVEATQNVIDYARRCGCAQFVFISSSSVYYQHGDQWNLTEETPFPEKPINLYAATKLEAERLVQSSGLPAVILRPRAVFGPGDTVLFPRILRAAQRGVLPRMSRKDGAAPQGDLIYIENLCYFVERAIVENVRGAFNLTNGEPVDLYGFLGAIFAELGYPPVTRSVPVGIAFPVATIFEQVSRLFLGHREPPITRFGVEVMAYSKTFDVTKALTAFGPPPVSLAEGVRRFVEWQRAQS
jgi:nucleoside-diphosphate-sugar epimerase